MIKILFFIEELHAGGAEKVLCNLVNSMDQSQFEITVQTLWLSDASKYFHPGIRYQSCYSAKTKINRFIYRLEAALGLTYRLHIKDAYDVECAYLECAPTKIIASSTNKRAKKIAWVHCDLQQKMKQMPGMRIWDRPESSEGKRMSHMLYKAIRSFMMKAVLASDCSGHHPA